jgi:hypothetical protein
MKPTKSKGSKCASGARFCCHRRRPHETHQEQRQQMRLRSRIFAASATDQMNQTKENQKQLHSSFPHYPFTAPDFFVILEKNQETHK